MSASRFNPEKPLAITAVCIIGLINASQMINLIISPMVERLGEIYPAYFTVSALISLTCIAGLWLLKRWAALIYGIILVANQIALVCMKLWGFSALIIPAVILFLLYSHKNDLV